MKYLENSKYLINIYITSYIIILHVYVKFKINLFNAREKYRGMFEIRKSGDKTSSGEIGFQIRTHASPKVGQDRMS